MKFSFLKYTKFYYLFSGLLVLVSCFAIFRFGLNFGMEFTGGSLIELEFEGNVPENADIQKQLEPLALGDFTVQSIGANGVLLRLKQLSQENRQKILETLQGAKESRFETIGPLIGEELKKKTQIAVLLSLLMIIFYIAFAFRKLTWPTSPWQYGVAALAALFHDLIIPLGIFAVLGKLYNVEINIPFVAALLTVLGYSISDTVVVYDRVRENLLKRSSKDFEEMVDDSLRQTLARSVTTGIAAILTLLAIFFFGGQTLKYFALVLIIGIFSGTYSSIFVATPILVSWAKSRMLTKTAKSV